MRGWEIRTKKRQGKTLSFNLLMNNSHHSTIKRICPISTRHISELELLTEVPLLVPVCDFGETEYKVIAPKNKTSPRLT